MRITSLLVLLTLSLVPSASAEQLHSANDAGDLAVEIVVSPTKDFIHDWISKPANKAIHITRVRTIVPDQTVYAAFLVSGHRADAKQFYNFSVSWRLLKADGAVVIEQKNFADGNRLMPKRPSFVMAEPALDLTLDSTDRLGKYTLEATVEDKVAGTSSTAVYTFNLVKN